MGFAFVGLADDENSTFWNPAGLGDISNITAGFLKLINLDLLLITMPMP